MNVRRVQLGQAGIASHGRTILHAVRDAGNLRLVSCYDINTRANETVAKEYDARAVSSYDELVNDPSIEAVALVTPNHLHAEQVEKAIAARKHVFVEKPIAGTVAEARQMVERARGAGVTLMVGHNTRRRRAYRRAKVLIDEGRIGQVVAVEANLSRPAGLQPDLPAWKADPTKCALLPMMQLGIHFVDTIEFLLGSIARVSCYATNIAMPGGVLDSAIALLQLASGIPISLISSYVSPDAFILRIYGTGGALHISPTRLRLELLKDGEVKEVEEEDFSTEGAESFILQMREFGECVVSGKKPETGGEVGLQALAVVEAMVRSIQTHATVEIDEVLRVSRHERKPT